jgi:hypothetical protein
MRAPDQQLVAPCPFREPARREVSFAPLAHANPLIDEVISAGERGSRCRRFAIA